MFNSWDRRICPILFYSVSPFPIYSSFPVLYEFVNTFKSEYAIFQSTTSKIRFLKTHLVVHTFFLIIFLIFTSKVKIQTPKENKNKEKEDKNKCVQKEETTHIHRLPPPVEYWWIYFNNSSFIPLVKQVHSYIILMFFNVFYGIVLYWHYYIHLIGMVYKSHFYILCVCACTCYTATCCTFCSWTI